MLTNQLDAEEHSLNPVGIEADAPAWNIEFPFAPEED